MIPPHPLHLPLQGDDARAGAEPLHLGMIKASRGPWESRDTDRGFSISRERAAGPQELLPGTLRPPSSPPPTPVFCKHLSSVELLALSQRLRFLIHRKALRLHVPLEKGWGLALMVLESEPPPICVGARDQGRVSGGRCPTAVLWVILVGAYQFQGIWTKIASSRTISW